MAFPRIVKVSQDFPRLPIQDVPEEHRKELRKEGISNRIKPGMRVAITAGSRGVSGIDFILSSLVEALKEVDAEPFIVPAMGSHGGATAEGQVAVLEGLGITGGTSQGSGLFFHGGSATRRNEAWNAGVYGPYLAKNSATYRQSQTWQNTFAR